MDAESIVLKNREVLEQGVRLISGLDPEVYRHSDQNLNASCVGAHFRHILDFYDCALTGYRTCIDYCNRNRDPLTENEPKKAVSRIRATADKLDALMANTITDNSVAVAGFESSNRDHDDASSGVEQAAASTIGRELQFLLDHTIHHYAIIALILRIQSAAVPEEFGVAPFTLKYRESASRLKEPPEEERK